MPGLNKRSVINMNNMQFNREYTTINFLKMAYLYGPSTTPDFALLDANGYGTNNSIGELIWAFNLPSSANAPGAYVLKWTGDGTVWLNDGYTWTESSINVTRTSNGRYTGTNGYIVATLTGFPGGLFDVRIHTFNNSNPITDLKFYMLADEADLLAGKIFRRGWKQTLLDFNPGVIRMLNWTGGSSNPLVRWSDRIPPNYNQYVNSFRTLPYGATTGTQDQVLAGVTGTPVAMRQGEIAQFMIGPSSTSNTTGSVVPSTISKGTNGRVTTSAAHNFTTGMKIIHFIQHGATGSMWQLHYKVATITVINSTQYDLNINTSAFDDFTGVGYNYVMPHVTLSVGGRPAYPVFLFQPEQPMTIFGNFWAPGGMACVVFDKYLTGDMSIGPGMWRTFQTNVQPGSFAYYNPGCPIEVCTALVNELNAEKQLAHPGSGAINMWITVPYAGLLSVDPDYDANENLVVKTIDRCLNGDGGSWAGLTAAAALLVEYSNETWNAVQGFDAGYYLARIGQARYGTWPGGTGSGSYADVHSFATTRATAFHQDIAAAYPTQLASGRLIRVMGAHAGSGPVSGGPNNVRVDGNASTLGDAWNTGGTAPYTKYEAIAWAPYFDVAGGRYTTDLPTYTANWLAAVGAPAKEAVCAGWVAFVDMLGSDYGRIYETTVQLPQSAPWMVARGKSVVHYEGGYNWPTSTINTGLTTDQAAFLTAVLNSTAWASSQRTVHNTWGATTGAYHPALYFETTDNRWGYNRPHFDNYLGGVEGAALNQTWATISEYNNVQDGLVTPPDPGVTTVPLMLALRLRLHA